MNFMQRFGLLMFLLGAFAKIDLEPDSSVLLSLFYMVLVIVGLLIFLNANAEGEED